MPGQVSRDNGKKGGRPVGTAPKAKARRKAIEAAIARNELSAERVLEEFRRLAFSDVRRLYDENGNLKPLHTLSDEDAACIAGVEVIIKNAAAGDGVTDKIHKIKVWDKSKNLENLAKHFALLTEKVQHSGGIVFRHELPDD